MRGCTILILPLVFSDNFLEWLIFSKNTTHFSGAEGFFFGIRCTGERRVGEETVKLSSLILQPVVMSRLSMRLSVAESGLRVQPTDFKVRVTHLVDETLESLQSIWNEAGYEESECQGLLGDILTKLKSLCSAELSAEQQILEHAKNQVLTKYHEYQKYCSMLDRTGVNYDTALGENYADRLSELEKLISDIDLEVSQRQDILNAKREEVTGLASQLGEEIPADYDGGSEYCELADIRIDLINNYKRRLEELKDARSEEMNNLAADLRKCLVDLAVEKEGAENLPDFQEFGDIDKILLESDDIQRIGCHQRDLSRLVLRLKGLQSEKERRKNELSQNGTEIARMWTLLRVPPAERSAFQSSFEMNLSLATLAKGREELRRLKQLRMDSLGTVVSSLREEISGYLQELGVTSNEQILEEFPLYFSPVEDLDDNAVSLPPILFSSSLDSHQAGREARRVLLSFEKQSGTTPSSSPSYRQTRSRRGRESGTGTLDDQSRETDCKRTQGKRRPKERRGNAKACEEFRQNDKRGLLIPLLLFITSLLQVLTQIALWEESNGGSIFLYGVSLIDPVARFLNQILCREKSTSIVLKPKRNPTSRSFPLPSHPLTVSVLVSQHSEEPKKEERQQRLLFHKRCHYSKSHQVHPAPSLVAFDDVIARKL
jgi:hypothetical protein